MDRPRKEEEETTRIAPSRSVPSEDNAGPIMDRRPCLVKRQTGEKARKMATLAEWIKHLERQVGEAITGAGLSAALRKTVEGPQTITLTIQLMSPTPANITALGKLSPTITALTGQQTKISQRGAYHIVQVEHPRPWTPTASSLAKYGRKFTVPIGVDEHARIASVTFGPKHCPVLAYIGPPGAGKSTAIMSTVAMLANQAPPSRARFYVASKKAADWQQFKSLPHTEETAGTVSDSIELIRYIAGPVLEHRQQTNSIWPAVFLIADDVTGLIEADKTIGSPLTVIATEGRAHQVFLILGLHGAGRKAATGNGMLDDSIKERIVYRPNRSDSSSRNTGQKGTDLGMLSNRQGDALHIAGRTQHRIATPRNPERILDRIAPAVMIDDEDEPRHDRSSASATTGAAPEPLHGRSSERATATRERSTRSTAAPPEQGDTIPAHVPATCDPAPLEQPGAGAGAPPKIQRVAPGQIEAPASIGAPREPTTAERAEIVRYIIQRRLAGLETSGRHLIDLLYDGKRGKTTQAITKSLLQEAERAEAEVGLDPFAEEPAPAPLPQRETEEERLRRQIAEGTIDWNQYQLKGEKVR